MLYVALQLQSSYACKREPLLKVKPSRMIDSIQSLHTDTQQLLKMPILPVSYTNPDIQEDYVSVTRINGISSRAISQCNARKSGKEANQKQPNRNSNGNWGLLALSSGLLKINLDYPHPFLMCRLELSLLFFCTVFQVRF